MDSYAVVSTGLVLTGEGDANAGADPSINTKIVNSEHHLRSEKGMRERSIEAIVDDKGLWMGYGGE